MQSNQLCLLVDLNWCLSGLRKGTEPGQKAERGKEEEEEKKEQQAVAKPVHRNWYPLGSMVKLVLIFFSSSFITFSRRWIGHYANDGTQSRSVRLRCRSALHIRPRWLLSLLGQVVQRQARYEKNLPFFMCLHCVLKRFIFFPLLSLRSYRILQLLSQWSAAVPRHLLGQFDHSGKSPAETHFFHNIYERF